MIIKHDLSTEGIKNFEREHLLYTIDEMLRMDNERRWAELTVITHFKNWMEDDKKVNTAQTFMYLIEIEKGRLDCQMGRDMSYIEQYLLVKWAKEGVPTVKIANRTRRNPNTIRRILQQHGVKIKTRTASKPVVIVTRGGQRLEINSAKRASETEWCDITANALRVRLCKHRVYSNRLATFYYKEDEEKWN